MILVKILILTARDNSIKLEIKSQLSSRLMFHSFYVTQESVHHRHHFDHFNHGCLIFVFLFYFIYSIKSNNDNMEQTVKKRLIKKRLFFKSESELSRVRIDLYFASSFSGS